MSKLQFKIIFGKDFGSVDGPSLTEEEDSRLGQLALEVEEIEEIRKLVDSLKDPDPTTYSST